jgi:RNA polymerase sigma-70 factor (ECF subfamily)
MRSEPLAVTELLIKSRGGDREALDALVPAIYDQLHALAERSFRSERPNHTLCATALVNEAYLRLIDSKVEWQDRVHFFAVAARVMRRILVDHARTHNRARRGAGAVLETFDEALTAAPGQPAVVIALDEALDRLARLDRRRSDLLEMLYFGGLSYTEAAAALHISESTLLRDLKLARAWLKRQLNPGA